MTISLRVRKQLIESCGHHRETHNIIDTHVPGIHQSVIRPRRRPEHWTDEEHKRFLQALEIFPSGPWRFIAGYVGTKTTRQAMAHGQKYRQKCLRKKIPPNKPVDVTKPQITQLPADQIGFQEPHELQQSIVLDGSLTAHSPTSTDQLAHGMGTIRDPLDHFNDGELDQLINDLVSVANDPPRCGSPYVYDI